MIMCDYRCTNEVVTEALRFPIHPVSITRFPLSRFSQGAGLHRNPFLYTINAKTFQGLGPKRRESCNGDRCSQLSWENVNNIWQHTVGFHHFNLRIFNLRVSNPNKLIVDVFLTRCRISICQGLGPKKHDENSEIDRMTKCGNIYGNMCALKPKGNM